MTYTAPNPAGIRENRLANGLTQAQSAALIHVTTQTWSQYERGLRHMHPAFWNLYTLKTS